MSPGSPKGSWALAALTLLLSGLVGRGSESPDRDCCEPLYPFFPAIPPTTSTTARPLTSTRSSFSHSPSFAIPKSTTDTHSINHVNNKNNNNNNSKKKNNNWNNKKQTKKDFRRTTQGKPIHHSCFLRVMLGSFSRFAFGNIHNFFVCGEENSQGENT